MEQPALKKAKHSHWDGREIKDDRLTICSDLLICILNFLLSRGSCPYGPYPYGHTLEDWRRAYGVSRHWQNVMNTRSLVYSYMPMRVHRRGDEPVTDRLINLLAHIPLLANLDLRKADMQLWDFEHVKEFTSLTSLDLSQVSIVHRLTLAVISNHTSLRKLKLRDCKNLLSLEPLARLTNLTCLDISGCRLSMNDLTPLKGLLALRVLRLDSLEAIESLQFLSWSVFAGLRCLGLNDLHNLGDLKGLNPKNLPNLRHLDFGDFITPSHETSTAIDSLTSLASLSLYPAEDHYEEPDCLQELQDRFERLLPHTEPDTYCDFFL